MEQPKAFGKFGGNERFRQPMPRPELVSISEHTEKVWHNEVLPHQQSFVDDTGETFNIEGIRQHGTDQVMLLLSRGEQRLWSKDEKIPVVDNRHLV